MKDFSKTCRLQEITNFIRILNKLNPKQKSFRKPKKQELLIFWKKFFLAVLRFFFRTQYIHISAKVVNTYILRTQAVNPLSPVTRFTLQQQQLYDFVHIKGSKNLSISLSNTIARKGCVCGVVGVGGWREGI